MPDNEAASPIPPNQSLQSSNSGKKKFLSLKILLILIVVCILFFFVGFYAYQPVSKYFRCRAALCSPQITKEDLKKFETLSKKYYSDYIAPYTAPATWKKITYKPQGFSFAYPPDELSLDYPEECFSKLEPYNLPFSAYFHKKGPNASVTPQFSYYGCELPGEDGSQFSVDIYPREHDIKGLLNESYVEHREIRLNDQTMYIIHFNVRGGEGGNRIYFNRNGHGYQIHFPSTESVKGTEIEPLFMNILGTFTWENNGYLIQQWESLDTESFSIDYPKGWAMSTEAHKDSQKLYKWMFVSSYSQDALQITITQLRNFDETLPRPAYQLFTMLHNAPYGPLQEYDKSEVKLQNDTVDGVKAVVTASNVSVNEPIYHKTVYLFKSPYFYKLSLSQVGASGKEEPYNETFKHFYNSFRFKQ